MDESINLFISIKNSQIYKIKNEFENYKKSTEEANEELFNLSEEIDGLLEKNNNQDFQVAAKCVREKIDETLAKIMQEDVLRG